MQCVGDFCLNQTRGVIDRLKCNHVKAAEYIAGNYEDHWNIPYPDDQDETHNISVNSDITVQCLIDEDSECFLGVHQTNGKLSVLYTVSKKQKMPLCSICSSTKCKCFHQYKDAIRVANDTNQEIPEFHWEKRRTETPVPRDDYEDILELNEQYKKYGCNLTHFEYPIKRDPVLQERFVTRSKGHYDIPQSLKPQFMESLTCQHGFGFDSSDASFLQSSKNLIIYAQTQDIVLETASFARPTVPAGSCRCLQQYDGHPVLLWNLGCGRMVDYTFLHFAIHQVVNGTPMNSIYQSRSTVFSSLGLKSGISYQDFARACSGYASMMKFRKEDFLCSSCGQTPRYLVADGKMCGPTSRKVKHLSELDRHEDDDTVLEQGSHFKDRVFLFRKPERTLVRTLLTEEIGADEFIASDVLQTDNSRLLIPLIERIQENWPEEIPKPYSRFIANIAKPTSVASYMQVTHDEPLTILKLFCEQTLNLSALNQDKVHLITKELPALWPNLMDILEIEKTQFLPIDVSNILIKMIDIRRNTFRNAAERTNADYIPWTSPDEEHPTSFYPQWPIFRHPKKYEVRAKQDADFCDKAFDSKSGFAFGLFSVGCSCPANITYGFELMLSRESAHNLFRLLMCRNLDMDSLEGIIFDFACGLDPYLLNR